MLGWWRAWLRERKHAARKREIRRAVAAAIADISIFWRAFVASTPFKNDTPVEMQISAFIPLALQRLGNRHVYVTSSPDPTMAALVIALAVTDSETHERAQLKAACDKIWPFLADGRRR